jgi:hypothetical protein
MDALIFDRLRGFHYANTFGSIHIDGGFSHATFSVCRAVRTHFIQLLPDSSLRASIVLYRVSRGYGNMLPHGL